ncbi:MAG: hypothetical protein JJU11_09000, partial [Candidatus Sumerlaeia bacterium]|nr:hypothetical protein [Candidatus Sumerlaeia bacterium]
MPRNGVSGGIHFQPEDSRPPTSMIEFITNPANQLVALFLILGLGIFLGRIELKGVSLGTSGVLFVAIIFGHLGVTLPEFITQVGVVLFVYAVGLMAGPRFFKTFRRDGLSFAALALVTLGVAFLAAVLVEWIFRFGGGLSAGLFTGALTTTPGLAAAMEAVDDPEGSWAAQVSVGYGLAYPLGVAGVVLFIQLFPRIMRLDLRQMAREESQLAKSQSPQGHWYQLSNPQLVGRTIGQLMDQHLVEVTISRVERKNGEVFVARPDLVFETGDIVRVIAKPRHQGAVETVLGPMILEKSEPDRSGQGPVQSRDVFITEAVLDGKSLRDLQLPEHQGVVVARLWREEIEFVPQAGTRLAIGDLVRVVGTREDCEKFIELAGNAERKLQQTNFLPLCLGLVVGVLIGRQQITLPGTDFGFSLGLAGGPLFVALIAGHYGRIGRMSIRMPMAAKIFIRELGLMFFLAGAGVVAGREFLSILMDQGLSLIAAGAIVTVLPMVA